jgi:hypothetical protein
MADRHHKFHRHLGNPSRPPAEMIERAASVEAANPSQQNSPQIFGIAASGRGENPERAPRAPSRRPYAYWRPH